MPPGLKNNHMPEANDYQGEQHETQSLHRRRGHRRRSSACSADGIRSRIASSWRTPVSHARKLHAPGGRPAPLESPPPPALQSLSGRASCLCRSFRLGFVALPSLRRQSRLRPLVSPRAAARRGRPPIEKLSKRKQVRPQPHLFFCSDERDAGWERLGPTAP